MQTRLILLGLDFEPIELSPLKVDRPELIVETVIFRTSDASFYRWLDANSIDDYVGTIIAIGVSRDIRSYFEVMNRLQTQRYSRAHYATATLDGLEVALREIIRQVDLTPISIENNVRYVETLPTSESTSLSFEMFRGQLIPSSMSLIDRNFVLSTYLDLLDHIKVFHLAGFHAPLSIERARRLPVHNELAAIPVYFNQATNQIILEYSAYFAVHNQLLGPFLRAHPITQPLCPPLAPAGWNDTNLMLRSSEYRRLVLSRMVDCLILLCKNNGWTTAHETQQMFEANRKLDRVASIWDVIQHRLQQQIR